MAKCTPGFSGRVLYHSPLGRSKRAEASGLHIAAGTWASLGSEADLRASGLYLETGREKCGKWGMLGLELQMLSSEFSSYGPVMC